MPGPGTWSPGDVLTADDLNAIGTWTSYTPVLKQGTTTVTATVNSAYYMTINKFVVLNVDLSVTAAGPGNQDITITLPVNASTISTTVRSIGAGIFYDASATDVMNTTVQIESASAVAFYSEASTLSGFFGTSPALTLANGDGISFSCFYQAA